MSQQSVLVTGGTGTLGQALTPQLRQAGYTLRVMSRRDAPAGITVEWARASLETGEGLDTAVAGTEVIIHAASSSTRRAQQVDVVGTERLLAAAHRAGVGHFIYISIVGIEQVPFPYYRYKLAAEKLVEAGGGPEVQTLGRWPGYGDRCVGCAGRWSTFLCGAKQRPASGKVITPHPAGRSAGSPGPSGCKGSIRRKQLTKSTQGCRIPEWKGL